MSMRPTREPPQPCQPVRHDCKDRIRRRIPESVTDATSSGNNHYEAAEVSGYGKMRLTAGINPQSFSWLLAPGENFAAPGGVARIPVGATMA